MMTRKSRSHMAPEATRRAFLRAGSAALSAAAAAAALSSQAASAEGAAPDPNGPPNVPEWMKAPGADVGSELYGSPSPFEKSVIRNVPKGLKQYTSASSRVPLQELDGIITPNGVFYERHHGDVPAIDPAQHRLMIHGLVERQRLFAMEDIRRYPSESRVGRGGVAALQHAFVAEAADELPDRLQPVAAAVAGASSGAWRRTVG
jgi:sulfane dehydrogenase subunit SoxC